MSISENSSASRLDAAAAVKDRHYVTLCAEAGWSYQALPADTYGALHADSRRFVGRLISRAIKANPFADAARTASAVWREVSSAAVGHAASQLAEMAEYDSPLGLDLKILDNLTPCPADGAEDAADDCIGDVVDEDEIMGTSLPEQPRSAPAAAMSLGSHPPSASAGGSAMDQDDCSGESGFPSSSCTGMPRRVAVQAPPGQLLSGVLSESDEPACDSSLDVLRGVRCA